MARRKAITLEADDIPAILAALKSYRDTLDSFLQDSEGDDVQNVRDERAHIDALASRFAAVPS